jgi:hypothetical protein
VDSDSFNSSQGSGTRHISHVHGTAVGPSHAMTDDSSSSCVHTRMLGTAAVSFRGAIAHAPSAASLGMHAALHMRVNSKKWDVGKKDDEVVYR